MEQARRAEAGKAKWAVNLQLGRAGGACVRVADARCPTCQASPATNEFAQSATRP